MKQLIKKLYTAIPFKKQIFSGLKKVWSPPHNVYQHLYFTGEITLEVDDRKSFKVMHYGHTVENDLFWKGLYGNWEKHALTAWIELCKNSSIIFDIGANTGIYSLLAKTVNPSAEVHAFEPFEAIYEKLVHNAAINHYNIKSNCKAVSNYSGDAVIYTEDPNFAYSVTVNQNLWVNDKQAIKLDIKTITLQDYIIQNNISAIDLMKIDVETHEPEVMEGFGSYYDAFKPILLIEVLTDDVVTKLNNIFAASNVIMYHIDEEKGLQQVPRLFKSKFYNFLIVPQQKKELLFSALPQLKAAD